MDQLGVTPLHKKHSMTLEMLEAFAAMQVKETSEGKDPRQTTKGKDKDKGGKTKDKDNRDKDKEKEKDEKKKKEKLEKLTFDDLPDDQLGPLRPSSAHPKLKRLSLSASTVTRPQLPKKIQINVIAMSKKANSKPMREILRNLHSYGYFLITVLDDDTILSADVSTWPSCDCLITYFSTGYPIEKVQEYIALHQPFLVNDVKPLRALLDRKETYDILEANDIPVPRHVSVSRSSEHPVMLEEHDDFIVVDGVEFQKPFVEKPMDSENHNVCIYFPNRDGGGRQNLFRKSDDKSSDFDPTGNAIRRDGDYLYEEFIPTGGTDIKVYTVGPDYAHAEARKSPVIDGFVLRGPDGKEIRCPVLLKKEEKEIARKVVKAFGMNICGFDLLRTDGRSLVCDVNGWSFVKRSPQYYFDCATLLRDIILQGCAPDLLHASLAPRPSAEALWPRTPSTPAAMHSSPTLRCVLAVIRHGDRTPKQKLKLTLRHPLILSVFARFKPTKRGELKLKLRSELEFFLSKCKTVLDSPPCDDETSPLFLSPSDIECFQTIEEVLTCRPISGINRKLQLKPTKWGTSMAEGKEVETVLEATLVLKWGGELTDLGAKLAEELGEDFRDNMYPQNEFGHGLLRLHSTYRHDLKIYASDEGRVQMTAAAFTRGLLALDMELTPILASLVTRNEDATTMLDSPLITSEVVDKFKARLSRISLSNDLAFLKELEISTNSLNELRTLVRELVRHLDAVYAAIKSPRPVRSKTKSLDELFSDSPTIDPLPHPDSVSSHPSPPEPEFHPSPEGHGTFSHRQQSEPTLVSDRAVSDSSSSPTKTVNVDGVPYTFKPRQRSSSLMESVSLVANRWKALYSDFYNEKLDVYDVTKVTDILEAARYEAIFNPSMAADLIKKVIAVAEPMVSLIVSEEYGVSSQEKVDNASRILSKLLMKLSRDFTYGLKDMQHTSNSLDSDERPVRTRLYFTSESHILSLANLFKCGSFSAFARQAQPSLSHQHEALMFGLQRLQECATMGYLSHFVMRMFERNDSFDETSRFYVDIQFSPGQEVLDGIPSIPTTIPLFAGLSHTQMEAFFNHFISHSTDVNVPLITDDPSSMPLPPTDSPPSEH